MASISGFVREFDNAGHSWSVRAYDEVTGALVSQNTVNTVPTLITDPPWSNATFTLTSGLVAGTSYTLVAREQYSTESTASVERRIWVWTGVVAQP